MKNNSKNSKNFVRHLQNPLVFFFLYIGCYNYMELLIMLDQRKPLNSEKM